MKIFRSTTKVGSFCIEIRETKEGYSSYISKAPYQAKDGITPEMENIGILLNKGLVESVAKETSISEGMDTLLNAIEKDVLIEKTQEKKTSRIKAFMEKQIPLYFENAQEIYVNCLDAEFFEDDGEESLEDEFGYSIERSNVYSVSFHKQALDCVVYGDIDNKFEEQIKKQIVRELPGFNSEDLNELKATKIHDNVQLWDIRSGSHVSVGRHNKLQKTVITNILFKNENPWLHLFETEVLCLDDTDTMISIVESNTSDGISVETAREIAYYLGKFKAKESDGINIYIGEYVFTYDKYKL